MKFLIRFVLRSTVFGFRGHEMENVCFLRRLLFIDNFSPYMKDTNENDNTVFALSTWFTTCTFGPWKINFKVWPQVRPGQDQVMSQVSQYAYHPKWLDEQSPLAPFAKLSPSCRELLAKSGLWPHVSSYDFPVTPDQLHSDLHSWDQRSCSWKLWVVSVSFCETEHLRISP